MKDILLISGGLIAGLIAMFIRNLIMKKTKDLVKEKWNTSKFLDGVTNITNAKQWGQTLSWWLNFRNWIIIGLICSVIFGYGYWKGLQGKPIKIDLGYGKEANIKLNGHYLHIYKDGSVYVEDEKGNKIKQIQVKDIEGLKKKLAPYGIICQPYISLGGAMTKKGLKQDMGVGLNLLKYYKWLAGTWLSNNGIWLGVDYKLTDNFAIGGGVGKGYKGDNLVGFRGQWRF